MTTTRSRRTTREFSCSETIILIYWNGCRGRSPTENKKGLGSSSLTEEEEEEVAVAQRSERNRVVIKQENDNDNHITHSLQWNLQTSDSSWVEIEDRESQQVSKLFTQGDMNDDDARDTEAQYHQLTGIKSIVSTISSRFCTL